MLQRTITLAHGWLHFPIGSDVQRYYVRFDIDGEPLTELYLGLVSDRPDFYCGMELEKYIGRRITLTLTDPAPDGLLDGILEGPAMSAENPLYPNLYHEEKRPRWHFSSRRGWLNDPNGLFFDGENYHLYYQHNPYGITHGGTNVHWGHAVSRDGLRWTEYPDALRPWTRRGHIASGSCLIDAAGAAGFGRNAVIAAFTHLGSVDHRNGPAARFPAEGQFLAVSTDGGYTFTRFPDNPAVPTENAQPWRDPRLFMNPDGGFGMAVYETTKKGNCVSFYKSPDFHIWRRVSRTDDLYECPDLFPLTPQDGSAAKWVLYGADGMVRIGDFKDGHFIQQSEPFPLDFGPCVYAGQTWTGRDDTDSRMHIGWLHDIGMNWERPSSYPGMPFSQCMSVPCLLTLVRTPSGYRLDRNPIPALTSLRTGETVSHRIALTKEADLSLPLCADSALSIEAESAVTVTLGGQSFSYDPQTGAVSFPNRPPFVLRRRGTLSLRVLTDVMSCEFFLQGEISASYGLPMAGQTVRIACEGGLTLSGESHILASVWP